MLPRAWFTPKSTEDQLNSLGDEQSGQTANGITNDNVAGNTSSRPPIDRAITAALSTPHDAVLAELQGHRPSKDTTAKLDAAPEAPTLPAISEGTGELDPNAAHPPAPGTGESVLSASPEPVYDPCTGNLAFVLPAAAPAQEHFEQAKDELWGQLGRIRALQSEIARRHLQMEGIGGMGEGGRGSKKPPPRTHTDTIVVGEDWPDPAEEEQEKKKARDAEFDNLAQAFEGRHTAIDGIMDKLDELSKVLTTFHALPTPAMDFSSRSNTKDSMTMMFSSPSPTFTTVPSSPVSSGPASRAHTSMQAAAEALHIPRAESPVSDLPEPKAPVRS